MVQNKKQKQKTKKQKKKREKKCQLPRYIVAR